MWRNFSFPCTTIVGKLKNSPHVEKFQYNWWGFIAIYAVLLPNLLLTLFCRKIFATIYALSCGEKLSPKSTFVEKKWQIWGLNKTDTQYQIQRYTDTKYKDTEIPNTETHRYKIQTELIFVKCHKLYLWRKNCHVEKFWEILGNIEENLPYFGKNCEILGNF